MIIELAVGRGGERGTFRGAARRRKAASQTWARSGPSAVGASVLALIVCACAGPEKPVLYPNAHLQKVGERVAKADVTDCERLAMDYGLRSDRNAEIGTRAAKGAAVGGAASGAWGVVRGDAGSRALAGAAAGAAGGATAGVLDSGKPDPIFQRYVERCLSDRGYSVIGWR